MPVVGIPVDRLRALLGREIAPDELLRTLGYLGCDVEGYTRLARVRCLACGTIHERTAQEEVPPACENCGADLREAHDELPSLDVIRMELLAVRPDMFDPGGLARALRGYFGIETGSPRYALAAPQARLTVEPGVRRPESWRPWIACAVVARVVLDEDSLKILMKLQENLHWAIGRDRKHASIGVYDFDRVRPELVYTVEDPDRFRFVPLGGMTAAGGRQARPGDRFPAAGGTDGPTLREILAGNPKGVAYAHLLAGLDRYPILKDRDGRVLSMPPIINSEETRVTAASRRLLIDVTGLSERVVNRTLNIMVTSLLENLPGAVASPVEITGPEAGAKRVTPDFTPQEMDLDPRQAARILGVEISSAQARELLGRMRHDVEALEDGRLRARVPVYRNDILHEMDLVEDVAIAFGYHRIPPSLVPTFTVGGERPIERAAEQARLVLCGLGYTEVMTLLLTNPEEHDRLLGRPPAGDAVRVSNPASLEQSMLRTSLLPGLLDAFRRNLTHPLPQRIFEVGEVTHLDPAAETGARDDRDLAAGIVAPRASFEEGKALAEAILREFGRTAEWRPCGLAPFLAGRAAEAWIRPPEGEHAAGSPAGAGEARFALRFGEVHPEVLERFGIQNPIVLLEGNVGVLAGLGREAGA